MNRRKRFRTRGAEAGRRADEDNQHTRQEKRAGGQPLFGAGASLHKKINELVRERRINDLLDENPPSGNEREYRYVEVREPIENRRPLDYATKLDRSPSFIREMIAYGEERADEFLDALSRTG